MFLCAVARGGGVQLRSAVGQAGFGRVGRRAPACPRPAHSIHPGPAGHQVLAELVAGLLQRAAEEVAAGLVPAQRQDARVAGLPPPMAPNYEDRRSSLCLQLVRARLLPLPLPDAQGSWLQPLPAAPAPQQPSAARRLPCSASSRAWSGGSAASSTGPRSRSWSVGPSRSGGGRRWSRVRLLPGRCCEGRGGWPRGWLCMSAQRGCRQSGDASTLPAPILP